MTDEEALKEIDRQEKRFAAAKYGQGLRLAKSAREYYETIAKLHREVVESEAGCLAAKRKVKELVAAAEAAEAEVLLKKAEARKLRERIFPAAAHRQGWRVPEKAGAHGAPPVRGEGALPVHDGG